MSVTCVVSDCERTDTTLCDVWDENQRAWLCPTDARRLQATPHQRSDDAKKIMAAFGVTEDDMAAMDRIEELTGYTAAKAEADAERAVFLQRLGLPYGSGRSVVKSVLAAYARVRRL